METTRLRSSLLLATTLLTFTADVKAYAPGDPCLQVWTDHHAPACDYSVTYSPPEPGSVQEYVHNLAWGGTSYIGKIPEIIEKKIVPAADFLVSVGVYGPKSKGYINHKGTEEYNQIVQLLINDTSGDSVSSQSILLQNGDVPETHIQQVVAHLWRYKSPQFCARVLLAYVTDPKIKEERSKQLLETSCQDFRLSFQGRQICINDKVEVLQAGVFAPHLAEEYINSVIDGRNTDKVSFKQLVEARIVTGDHPRFKEAIAKMLMDRSSDIRGVYSHCVEALRLHNLLIPALAHVINWDTPDDRGFVTLLKQNKITAEEYREAFEAAIKQVNEEVSSGSTVADEYSRVGLRWESYEGDRELQPYVSLEKTPMLIKQLWATLAKLPAPIPYGRPFWIGVEQYKQVKAFREAGQITMHTNESGAREIQVAAELPQWVHDYKDSEYGQYIFDQAE